ncbi:hypothetical protein SSX86_026373 [Deinandra increscens subsp. villosa]|uniref:Uncharacterized protein n=1 Tax=Deinandra increscens subsp. villosa TaxID=3103831 RepID=A0AAP0GN08_9ASTR
MGSSGTFSVNVKKRDIITAELPVQNHWLPMSNLDLLLPSLDFGVFFCYKNSLPLDESLNIVKKSLAEALATFYPLSGEIVRNKLGEPELHCNNRGVDFIHAYADMELKNIDLYHPDESVEGKLVPVKTQGVLAVQVTELSCGGLVIGCTSDHRVADAHSINAFLTAWAELAQSKPISNLPSFRRSMLNPRRPPITNTFYNTLYLPLSSLPPPRLSTPTDPLISRIYYMEAKDITHLQTTSSFNGNPKRSKLVSFTAFLWKIMAECEDGLNTCKMGVVVDGREKLENISFDKLSLSNSMQNYFGNVLSIPYGEANSSELKERSLGLVAEMVHDFVRPAMTEEHFLGLIDWVELNRPETAMVKVYAKMDENDGEAIVVSSGQRFPVDGIDFGWGKPHFGSYHFPWGGQTGYVMPMPSTRKNGDWIVYMHLLEKHLDLVETKGRNVFKPLTPAYLNL